MPRRGRFWLTVAKISTVANFVFAAIALIRGEPFHATAHAALLLLSGVWVWLLNPPSSRQATRHLAATDRSLDHLQQSLNAIALDVERIGEAQRFINTRVQGDRVELQRKD